MAKKKNMPNLSCDSSSAVYGMGMIGALVFYIQQAAGFNDFLFGFVKALFWPAFLIYKAIEVMGV